VKPMKGKLKDKHSMLLEIKDLGKGRNLIGNLHYGGKRETFSIPPSTVGGEKSAVQKFIHKEMRIVENRSEEEKVFKTSFDLINVVSWLKRDSKAITAYEDGGRKKLLEHLKSLRKVLKDSIPAPERMERHVDLSEIRESYENLRNSIGTIPKGPETSKEVCVRMSGAESEYRNYRKKSEKILREVNDTIRSVENSIDEVEYF